MLYWSLMFLFVVLTAGLLAIAFTAAGARKILPAPYPHTCWDSATYIPPWLRRLRVSALAATCRIRRTRLGRLNWARGVRYFAIGPEGITVAVRVGFDDNRSLGPQETGGRIALPVFKEIMLRVYRDKLVGPVPEFPAQSEQRISDYLKGDSVSPPDLSNPPVD